MDLPAPYPKISLPETPVIRAQKEEAEKELAEALPALEKANEALLSLNKNDIVEIKSFVTPPALVQMTMEAVCVLLGEAQTWAQAKQIMSDGPNFIRALVEFDKDNIPAAVLKKLRKYTADPNFTPAQVASHSQAAMSMCLWVRAIETYAEVLKVVDPKRKRVAEAVQRLEMVEQELNEKQDGLRCARVHSERLSTGTVILCE